MFCLPVVANGQNETPNRAIARSDALVSGRYHGQVGEVLVITAGILR